MSSENFLEGVPTRGNLATTFLVACLDIPKTIHKSFSLLEGETPLHEVFLNSLTPFRLQTVSYHISIPTSHTEEFAEPKMSVFNLYDGQRLLGELEHVLNESPMNQIH